MSTRLLAAGELLLVGLILTAYLAGYIPTSEIPALFLLGWLSLRRRSLGWSAVGLRRPPQLDRTLLLGALAGVVYALVSIYALDPLIERLVGRPTDLSEFTDVRGNAGKLLVWLVLSWTLAALGEELSYRGYIMNRTVDLVGRTTRGWAIALIFTSALFGVSHAYQGAAGMISNVVAALLFGALYLAGGRNLWLPIMAHGMEDTVAFVLIFVGRYPGL